MRWRVYWEYDVTTPVGTSGTPSQSCFFYGWIRSSLNTKWHFVLRDDLFFQPERSVKKKIKALLTTHEWPQEIFPHATSVWKTSVGETASPQPPWNICLRPFVKLLPLQSLPASTRAPTGALASILDHKVVEWAGRRWGMVVVVKGRRGCTSAKDVIIAHKTFAINVKWS